jgi:hypothetical protein
MRKVLLEKEFSTEYPLPEDILVTGALNPSGVGTCLAYEQEIEVQIDDKEFLAFLKES